MPDVATFQTEFLFYIEYSISSINTCLISQEIEYDYIIRKKKAKNLIFKIQRIKLLMMYENDKNNR